MHSITYAVCPACSSAGISQQLIARDYTVSGKDFSIWECKDCTLRFTQHVPDAYAISDYYRSENYISHSDTRKGFINSLYHFIRKKTLQDKKKMIVSLTGLSGGRLLDIGAGTGAFSFHMQRGGWKVTAMEPDTAARAKAFERYNLGMFSRDEVWNKFDGKFDAVTMWHVLEHVDDLHGYLQQVKKLLKPGGKAFIAVPNYTSWDAGHYQSFWAAYDVPRHLYHFSPLSVLKLLEKHGLKLTATRPMWYDSFYISMLSEKYKTGHANYLKAFGAGIVSNMKAIKNRNSCSSLIYIVEKPG